MEVLLTTITLVGDTISLFSLKGEIGFVDLEGREFERINLEADSHKNMSPETWFILLLFLLVTVPVFIGAVALINRAMSGHDEDEVEKLKRRVEELESEQD